MSTRMPVGPALEEAIGLLREVYSHLPHTSPIEACPSCTSGHRVAEFLERAQNVRKRGSPGKRSGAKPVAVLPGGDAS